MRFSYVTKLLEQQSKKKKIPSAPLCLGPPQARPPYHQQSLHFLMNIIYVFVIVLQVESLGKRLEHSVTHNIMMKDCIIKLKTNGNGYYYQHLFHVAVVVLQNV